MDTRNEKQKILIVDDSEMNRSILADMLGEEYEIIEAVDGTEAVARLNIDSTDISLMLLDIVMPNMDGFEVLEVMNKRDWIQDIPVIMISVENSYSYVERAYELGVTDFINRPFDGMVVHRRVINTIMLYAKQKKLVELVADQIYEKEKSNSLMISILSHIVEFRNGESGLHVLHINMLTEILLRRLMKKTDKYNLKRSDVFLISTASALHDVGKIAIPGEILNKPGKLTKEEFEIMKTHTLAGAEMLDQIPYYREEALTKMAYQICRWHHERYDGRGYPDGLKGEEIPISAQIVALADVYDALTSVRVYKPAFTHEKALEMIVNGECGTFNPLLLECLAEESETIRDQLRQNSIKQESERNTRNIAESLLEYDEISASERTLKLLEHERTKYQFFASLSQDIQFEYTCNPAMVTISTLGAEKLGLPGVITDPIHDEYVRSLISKQDWNDIADLLHATSASNPVVRFECMLDFKGRKRKVNIVARATWSSEEPPRYEGALGKVIDIHESYLKMANLKHMATHDAMTGLLNHKTAKQRIEDRLKDRPHGHHALMLLDLDHFKSANDTYGHQFGDEVLMHIANKIRNTVRSGDITARVGGDEFLIFLECKDDVDPGINRIYKALLGDYQDFKVSISMGIAKVDMLGTNYQTLFSAADKALYTVKRGGRGYYRYYDSSMEATLTPEKETQDVIL